MFILPFALVEVINSKSSSANVAQVWSLDLYCAKADNNSVIEPFVFPNIRTLSGSPPHCIG